MSEKTCGKCGNIRMCNITGKVEQNVDGDCDDFFLYPVAALLDTLTSIGDEAEVEVNGVWMTPGAGEMARKATRRFTKENSDG